MTFHRHHRRDRRQADRQDEHEQQITERIPQALFQAVPSHVVVLHDFLVSLCQDLLLRAEALVDHFRDLREGDIAAQINCLPLRRPIRTDFRLDRRTFEAPGSCCNRPRRWYLSDQLNHTPIRDVRAVGSRHALDPIRKHRSSQSPKPLFFRHSLCLGEGEDRMENGKPGRMKRRQTISVRSVVSQAAVILFQSTRQWLILPIKPRHWPIQGHWPVDLPIRQWSPEWFATHQCTQFTNYFANWSFCYTNSS
jgi:hypothetical protein